MSTTKVRALRAPWSSGIELQVQSFAPGGKLDAVGTDVTMQTVESQGTANGPTLSIQHDAAQLLMDDLWHAGFRPSEGSGSAGSLAATERHLQDMRKIAFDLLGPKEAKP